MDKSDLRNSYFSITVYLILTMLIGIFIVLLPLNGIECNIVLDVQNSVQKTIGVQAFQVLTYIGDFYLWAFFTLVYLIYAYFKSRKRLGSATELAIFLVITTALTYFIKVVFARPRPNCPGLTAYDQDFIPSSSYPSGHVSRATGALVILSRGSRTKESLAVIGVATVSLCRIVLGAHYPTDVVGGIFLSLAAQKIANLSMPFFAARTQKMSPQPISPRVNGKAFNID
jgi:membrane-associated phospholipid phosphatase